jgi:hypothetical protein
VIHLIEPYVVVHRMALACEGAMGGQGVEGRNGERRTRVKASKVGRRRGRGAVRRLDVVVGGWRHNLNLIEHTMSPGQTGAVCCRTHTCTMFTWDTDLSTASSMALRSMLRRALRRLAEVMKGTFRCCCCCCCLPAASSSTPLPQSAVGWGALSVPSRSGSSTSYGAHTHGGRAHGNAIRVQMRGRL